MDLKNKELFLFDMDGTIYLDNDLICGALDTLNKIIKLKKKYIFLTNNSSKSKQDYLDKLKKLNIIVDETSVFTSGMAMGIYLNKFHPNKKIYLVGTSALESELKKYNINLINDSNEEIADVVVVGFDRELNYQKLEKACLYIDNGATFLATNIDYVCPIKGKRYIPDCGSICQMITNATKVKPHFIGKPEPDMINLLASEYNIPKNKIVMIGDRVYTDVTCGYNANVDTICVLSGESTIDTINESSIKPTLTLESIKDMQNLL